MWLHKWGSWAEEVPKGLVGVVPRPLHQRAEGGPSGLQALLTEVVPSRPQLPLVAVVPSGLQAFLAGVVP